MVLGVPVLEHFRLSLQLLTFYQEPFSKMSYHQHILNMFKDDNLFLLKFFHMLTWNSQQLNLLDVKKIELLIVKAAVRIFRQSVLKLCWFQHVHTTHQRLKS